MKLFGSIKELVSAVFRKNSQEITLRPNQSTTYTAARDIQFPPGDSAHVLVSTTSNATLTNKFIDGDDNTINDINLSSLKTVLGDADEVILRDGSGAVVSAKLANVNVDAAAAIAYSKLAIADGDLSIAKTSGLQTALDSKVDENAPITGATKTKITYDAKGLVTAGADIAASDLPTGINATKIADGSVDNTEFQRLGTAGTAGSGNLVTTDGTQVLTAKDIDGGTASNTSRLTLPKAATATLNALTRKQGTLLYDSTLNVVKYDDGSTLSSLATTSLNLVPAFFTFNTWNPSDVAGTETNANSLGTSTGDQPVSFSSLSSGTVTITFDTAGTYEIDLAIRQYHNVNISLSRLRLNYGGTATSYPTTTEFRNRLVVSGGTNNAEYAGTDYFVVIATAGQTLTVQGRFVVVGDAGTSSHQATVRGFIRRIK